MKDEEGISASMQKTAKAQQSFIKEVTIMIKQKNESMAKSQKGATMNSVTGKVTGKVPTALVEGKVEDDGRRTAEEFPQARDGKQQPKAHEQTFTMSTASALNKSHNDKLKQSLKHAITPKRDVKKTP